MGLRDYQQRSIDRLARSFGSGHKRLMLQLPCGGGKTMVACEIIRRAVEKGNRVAFCVPAVSLIDQTVGVLGEYGIYDVGVMQADHPMTNPGACVQVCSIQTLARRAYPDVSLVIIDEAHRQFEAVQQWMTDWSAIPFIGLSATPWSKGLGKYYDDLIVAGTTSDMIEQGYLCPFRVFAPSKPDLSKARTVAGDWHEGDAADAMKPLVGDVVTHWLDHAAGLPTLVFAVDRAHARKLQKQFEASGVSCGYVDAYTDGDERGLIADAFHEGELQVVVNVGCLTTGVDWDVRCIVLARPTKSRMLFVQMIGRGLRTAEGKSHCLILDHSDTHTRLGFVTDIQFDELDTGKEEKSTNKPDQMEPLPKACPSCAFVKPPKTGECPNCGFKPEKQSDIEHESGELQEITPKPKWSKADKQRWYSMLLHHCREKGYKRGWAAHKYKEKVGVWPKGLDDKPQEPDTEVANWIKHQKIKAAKAREKENSPEEQRRIKQAKQQIRDTLNG